MGNVVVTEVVSLTSWIAPITTCCTSCCIDMIAWMYSEQHTHHHQPLTCHTTHDLVTPQLLVTVRG